MMMSSCCDPVKRLPDDVLRKIFSDHLSAGDSIRANVVSKEWGEVVRKSMPYFNITDEDFLKLSPKELEAYLAYSIPQCEEAPNVWDNVLVELEETARAKWKKNSGKEWSWEEKLGVMGLNLLWFTLILFKWKEGKGEGNFYSACKKGEADAEKWLSEQSRPGSQYDWNFIHQQARAVRDITLLQPFAFCTCFPRRRPY